MNKATIEENKRCGSLKLENILYNSTISKKFTFIENNPLNLLSFKIPNQVKKCI